MQDQGGMLVVADTSGSMAEHGKAMLTRNLIGYVRELRRLSDRPWLLGDVTVLLWNEQATVVELSPDAELPLFDVGGRAQLPPMLAALDQGLAGDRQIRVLLLSDGHFSGADVAAFKAWQRGHPTVSVRTLAVGPDAAHAILEKLADPDGAFAAEEVHCAIETWTLSREPTLPTCLADVIEDVARGHP